MNIKNRVLVSGFLILFFCSSLVSCRTEREETEQQTIMVHLGTEASIDEQTIYFISDSWKQGGKYLLYTDLSSEIGGPLCGKAECTHQDESCNAYLSNTGIAYGLNLYEDRIYWISNKFSEEDGYAGRFLYSMKTDGTGRTEVRQLARAENRASMPANNLMVTICNDYVVECGSRTQVDNGIEKTVSEVSLYALDIKKKDLKLYQDIDTGYARINPEVSDGVLYYLVTKQQSPEDGQKWSQESQIRLFRYSFQSGESECVFQDQTDFFPWEFHVNGNEVFFSCVNDESHLNALYRLDLQDGLITEIYQFPKSGDGTTFLTEQGAFRREFLNGDLQQEYCSMVNYGSESGTSWNHQNLMLNENGLPLIYRLIGTNQEKIFLQYSGYGEEEQLPELLVAYSPKDSATDIVWQNEAAERLLQKNTEESMEDDGQLLKVELKLNPPTDGEIVIRDLRELDNYTVKVYYINDSDEVLKELKRKAYINGVLCHFGKMDHFPAKTRNSISEILLYEIRELQIPVSGESVVIRSETEGVSETGEIFNAEAEITVPIRFELE